MNILVTSLLFEMRTKDNFTRIVTGNAQTALIRNQYRCEAGTVEDALHKQFSEIYIDSFAKDECSAVEMERFWLPFPFCIQNWATMH